MPPMLVVTLKMVRAQLHHLLLQPLVLLQVHLDHLVCTNRPTGKCFLLKTLGIVFLGWDMPHAVLGVEPFPSLSYLSCN